jgi:hypothetical protein
MSQAGNVEGRDNRRYWAPSRGLFRNQHDCVMHIGLTVPKA